MSNSFQEEVASRAEAGGGHLADLEQLHVGRNPPSQWQGAAPASPLPPLDIERAVSARTGSDARTWTGHESDQSFWTNTAVEKSRAGSYDDDNKYLKSVATSVRDIHTSHSDFSQVKIISDIPPVPTLPSALAPTISFPHQVVLVIVCCLAQFLNLGAMNQTVAPIMTLADYFGILDYGTLSWFSAAYSMAVGTFILPAGRLGDMYGHKRIFFLGWIWFAVFSFITGFSYTSSNIVLFSCMRALQGIGPALLVPNAIALLARNFAVGNQRNTAFACFGAAGPTGATAGAVFTALIADYAWWPWCFWVLAIVCLIVAVITVFVIPGDLFNFDAPKSSLTFDYWGCFTGVSGLILVNFALNQAPLVGWTMWYIPSLLILGCAFLWTFVIVELNFTKDPLIPIRGLGKDAYFALGCIAAGWGSHGIWAYYLYLFLEQVQGHSAIMTSALTCPVAITGILFALSSVWLVKRIGVAWTMFIAMMNFLIGALLLATVPLNQVYWAQIFFSIIIMPGAMNLSFPSATMLLSNALPKEKQGIAASLVSTMVNYCISCGLGLAGSIHRSSFTHAVERNHIAMDPLPPLTLITPELSQARIESFRGPWGFACGLSGVGVIIAAVFIWRTQQRDYKRAQRLSKRVSRRVTVWFGMV